MNAMTEGTIIFVKKAEASEIITTEWAFLLDFLSFILDNLYDLVFYLLLVEIHRQVVKFY
jgi:hypothetical protein